MTLSWGTSSKNTSGPFLSLRHWGNCSPPDPRRTSVLLGLFRRGSASGKNVGLKNGPESASAGQQYAAKKAPRPTETEAAKGARGAGRE